MILEFNVVRVHLKQRFPMLMVDRVLEARAGQTHQDA